MTNITPFPVMLAIGFKLQFDTGISTLTKTAPAKSPKTNTNNINHLIDSGIHFGIKRYSPELFGAFVRNYLAGSDEVTPCDNENIKLSGKCTIVVNIDGERVDLSLPRLDANGKNNADALIRSIIDIARRNHGDEKFHDWLAKEIAQY
jgi:hypothetical protein